jgi:hypothetical protein
VEYKIYYINYQSNTILVSLEIENITNIFSNNTFRFVIWYINLNNSDYYPPGINYDNLQFPKNFFYIPNVGNLTLNRTVSLILYKIVNDSIYVYKGIQYLTENEYINWTYYVNRSGVPFRIYLYQYINDILVSNSTYILIKSNIINNSETIYFPSNVTMVSGRPIYNVEGDSLIFSLNMIRGIIIGIGAIIILIILLFRKSNSMG